MRKMKDSKIEWVGEIPEGWEVMPIRALFNENRKINYLGKVTKSLQFKMGTIVPKANFEAETDDFVADTILKYNIVDKGMIVLNGLNLNFDFVTKRVAMVRERGIITSAYISFYAKDQNQLIPEYATYLFKCYDNCAAFHNMGGGVRKILNFEELKHNLFVLPPYRVQHAIVDFLDGEREKIEVLKADIEAQIETLNEYKRSVITEAVTHGLNPAAPMKDSGILWIGNIPLHWICCKQKFFIQLINGRAYSDSEFETDGKYKILRVGNLYTNPVWYTSSLELSPEKYCKDGDLLYSWSMSYGPTIWHGEKVIYHYHIWKAVLRGELNKSFAFYYLSSLTNALLTEKHETTMSFVTMGIMNNSYIPVPPLDEQQAIADYLDKKCAQIDELIFQKQLQIKTLETYKKSIIFEYVTGKKEVI